MRGPLLALPSRRSFATRTFFAEIAELQGHVLELGCGRRPLWRRLSNASHVTCLDSNSASVDLATRRIERRPEARGHVTVALGQATGELPFAAGEFDAVIFAFVLCAAPQPHLLIAELARVTKPGGTLVCLEHVAEEAWKRSSSGRAYLAFRRRAVPACRVDQEPLAVLEGSVFATDHVERSRHRIQWQAITACRVGA